MSFVGRGATSEVSLKGGQRVLGRIKRLPTNIRKEIDKLVKTVADKISEEASQGTPSDTGKMKRDWRVERKSEGIYRVYNDSPGALPMETGFRLRGRTTTGWRVIPITDPSSKYYPKLILKEDVTHPIGQPYGYRMLERAFIKHQKDLVRGSANIWRKLWR